ncbi:MAG: YraN family protein [Ectothiorhodospiraceae bacterium]|jgi:putative endonuclease
MPALSRRKVGSQAELHALRYLRDAGLECLARNYQTRRGEIDLIMADRDVVVFVEVRQRSRTDFGDGIESVTRDKQRKLAAAALHYLQIHGNDAPCRFDVVAIDGSGDIEWVRNAFEVPG